MPGVHHLFQRSAKAAPAERDRSWRRSALPGIAALTSSSAAIGVLENWRMTSMLPYLLQKYLPFYVGAFVSILSLIWLLREKIGKNYKQKKWIKMTLDIAISLILAIPVGVISTNIAQLNNRGEIAAKLYQFKLELINKQQKNIENSRVAGQALKWPYDSSWPLCIKDTELPQFLTTSEYLEELVRKNFTNNAYLYCTEFLDLLKSPHVLTFRTGILNGKGIVTPYACFTRKDVALLYGLLEICEKRVKKESNILFFPQAHEKSIQSFLGKGFNNPSDFNFWLKAAVVANLERQANPSDQYALLLEGVSLFFTGREYRAVKKLEMIVNKDQSGLLAIPTTDDLIIFAYVFLYKYYQFPPLSCIDGKGCFREYDPKKALFYKELAIKKYDKRFNCVLKSFEKNHFYDLDWELNNRDRKSELYQRWE